MPTRRDPLRPLPVAPGPFHGEILGSYLHRLAIANNRPVSGIVQLLGPLPAGFSPLSNTTDGWTPESADRLATLAGRSPTRLARALPALADFLSPQGPKARPEQVIGRPCNCCTARRSPSASIVIILAPAHQHLCLRHRHWTRSTHDIPLTKLPEVLRAQHRLNQLARRHGHGIRQALELAWKVIDEWSAGGLPLDLGREWTRRLDHVDAHLVGKKISFAERHRLAAFPEIAVLAELILNPPTDAIDPRELYLATTAELSRRLARIYTSLGRQDPLYQKVCRARAFQFDQPADTQPKAKQQASR